MNSRQTIINNIDKHTLRPIFDAYLIELAQFDDEICFDNDGKPQYEYYDNFFSDKGNSVYCLNILESLAGFCFIRMIEKNAYELAEFYILEKHRRQGISEQFFIDIIETVGGTIELSTNNNNIRAISFYDRVFKKMNYTKRIILNRTYWKIYSLIE